MTTLGEWGESTKAAAASLPAANLQGLADGCKAGAATLDAAIRRALPSGRISGMTPIGAGWSVAGTRGLVKSIGPGGMIETGARAHDIAPRRSRTSDPDGFRPALKLPNGFRYKVHHPGTRPQRVLSNAVPSIVAAVAGEWANTITATTWSAVTMQNAAAKSAPAGQVAA